MRFYIIAGEASGDLQGSKLLQALQSLDAGTHCRAWGGDLMAAAGASIDKHIRELAFMGIVDVLRNLLNIKRNFVQCKQNIQDFKPDAIILIDYSGFNLRMAAWAKQQGYRVYYYVSPQVWASRPGRIAKIKAHVERVFCIFPFEKAFYAKHGLDVSYIGHPLCDDIPETYDKALAKAQFLSSHHLTDRPLIALLPGSRKQELRYILPPLLQTVALKPDYQFVIAQSSAIDSQVYFDAIAGLFPQGLDNLSLVQDQTYALLQAADAAIVKSGTSTLETALWQVPQLIVYKTGALLYEIGKRIIKVPYLGIVNIILDKAAVPELIQAECNPTRIAAELEQLLHEKTNQLADYQKLRQLLGPPGAARRAAVEILERLSKPL